MEYSGHERRISDPILMQIARDTAEIGNLKEAMSKICDIAKSNDGFPRCMAKEQRIYKLERVRWLVVAAVILGAVKVIFFA